MPLENIGAILVSTKQIGGDAIENAVAKAFLLKHVNDYDRVEFHVGLGPGLDLGPSYPPYVQKCATASSKARADMIVWRDGVPTVVEVKDRIQPAAMGQVTFYAHLLKEGNPKLLNVYKLVIGQTIQLGLNAFFDRHGIEIELFPGAYPVSGTNG